MTKHPTRIYRDPKSKSYSQRRFIKSVPSTFLAFKTGGLKDSQARSFIGIYIADSNKQIHRKCIESLRIAINRRIVREFKVKSTEYKSNLLLYPFEVIRKNKAPTGAGADRLSMGMRRAFGRTEGYVARVRKVNTRFLSVRFLVDVTKLPNTRAFVKDLVRALNSRSYLRFAAEAHVISQYTPWLSQSLPCKSQSQ